MRKFTILFFILLCLSFNIIKIAPLAAVSDIKEGLYKVSALNLLPDTAYHIQNVSPNGVYLLVFNENNVVQQSQRLEPNSQVYPLIPLKADYSIAIVGAGGNVTIS